MFASDVKCNGEIVEEARVWVLVCVLNEVVREDFTVKEPFEQRSEGGEGIGHVEIWGRAFQVEGPTSAKTLRCGVLENSKAVSVTEEE